MKKLWEFFMGPKNRVVLPTPLIALCFIAILITAAFSSKASLITSIISLGVIGIAVVINIIRMKKYEKERRKKWPNKY